MKRRVVPIGAIIAIVAVVTAARRSSHEREAGAPPDTMLAGGYAGAAVAGETTHRLRLAGTMTARLESSSADGVAPLVDTGAWTKDDAGAVVVTLAPRDDSNDSGDTLRFAVRGDTLVEQGTGSGTAGLTLIRSR